jgi:hypothetical protein
MTIRKLPPSRLVFKPQAADEVSTLTAPSGATINLITPAPKPAFSSDLDLVSAGLSKDLARKVCRDAGGRDVGRRVIVPTDKLEAFLSAEPIEEKQRRTAKTAPKKGATTADIAAANGLRLVDRGAK